MSTSITSLHKDMDTMTTNLSGLQNLGINQRMNTLEKQVEHLPVEGTTGTNVFLDISIAGHLETLVKCTNAHIDGINTATDTQSKYMEDLSETLASLLEYVFNTKTVLQQHIAQGQQQRSQWDKMAKDFSAKWPDFNQNAKILLTVWQNLEEIKDRVCTADMCQKNFEADRESVDTI